MYYFNCEFAGPLSAHSLIRPWPCHSSLNKNLIITKMLYKISILQKSTLLLRVFNTGVRSHEKVAVQRGGGRVCHGQERQSSPASAEASITHLYTEISCCIRRQILIH
jgi:hypothetical protein